MVKALFDTSILVAAFLSNHPKHQACTPWLRQVQTRQIQGYIANHTLAEIYAVLTRLPVKPIISPQIAQQLIQENLKEFESITLSTEDYERVIYRMVNLNLTGGAIYDALIAQAAINSKADLLLTLNPSHFTRLGDEFTRLIFVPN